MIDVFYKTFNSLLGDGLAWALRAMNIEGVIKSFLSIALDIRRYYIRISRLPFPTLQGGLLRDDERTGEEWATDIANLERQFGIAPNFADTLENRALVAEAQWALIGSQGRGYIENALQEAGIPVFVKENIPAVDLFEASATQYNSVQYGYSQFSTGVSQLLGNGQIWVNGSTTDPAEVPDTLTKWLSVFIVEGATWQERVNLTQSQYNSLLFILLKIKPAHTQVLLNVNIT